MKVCRTPFLVLLLAVPGIAGSDRFPEGVISDAWYLSRFNGVKIGYIHETVERRGDEVVTTTVELEELKVGFGTHLRTRDTTETVETLSGKPLRFSITQARAQTETIVKQDPENPNRFTGTTRLGDTEEPFLHIRGLFKDGKVTVAHEQFGRTYEEHFDVDPDTVMSWGRRRIVMGKSHIDERYESKGFDISDPARVTVFLGHVVGRERITLGGTSYMAVKVVEEKPASGTTLTLWYDDDGGLLRALVKDTLGASMERVRCRREEAFAENGRLDKVITRGLNLDRFVDVDESQRITYRLSTTDDKIRIPSIPNTGMQQVVVQPDGSVLITVTRLNVSEDTIAVDSSNSIGMESFLRPTWMITSDDPKIIEAASKTSGDANNDVVVAKRLWSYVHETVLGLTQNAAPPSAAEVIRTKEGVCTAHAVLLAAMARARGIPARLVGGFASGDFFSTMYYSGTGHWGSTFLGHQWVQLYLHGQWIDVDSTLDQPFPDPGHIATELTPGQPGTNEDGQTLDTLLMTGKLKLEVIRVKPLAMTGNSVSNR